MQRQPRRRMASSLGQHEPLDVVQPRKRAARTRAHHDDVVRRERFNANIVQSIIGAQSKLDRMLELE